MNQPAKLYAPTTHPEWLAPHSRDWYAQLGRDNGTYTYPWQAVITEPSGETLFEQELTAIAPGLSILDVGCGHGEFTRRWTGLAAQVTGIDQEDAFVRTGDEGGSPVRFVTARLQGALPFADDSFDLIYTRRGPSNWYPDARRVLRPGGQVIGMHPGDGQNNNLPELFPGLFPEQTGTPILDNLQGLLERSGLAEAEIETVTVTQYLPTPEDILDMRSFGQPTAVREAIYAHCLEPVREIFLAHAAAQGLPCPHVCYIVRAMAGK